MYTYTALQNPDKFIYAALQLQNPQEAPKPSLSEPFEKQTRGKQQMVGASVNPRAPSISLGGGW